MISIIVPAYNASTTLGDCLDALERQTVERELYELLVVDDGSQDATAEIGRRPGVTVLQQAHRGAAAARNLGVRTSAGDLLFFTDADCVPARDWIEQLRAPFADPEVVGAKGVYCTAQRQLVARFVQLEYEDKYDRLRPRPSIDFIDTYSAAYRRAAFEAVGGFDPRFLCAEDQELSFRLAARGARLVFAPRAVVGHHHADSLRSYARKKFASGYWKFTVAAGRHRSKVISDAHTPQVMKVQMLLVLGIAVAAAGALLYPPLLVAAAAGALFFALSTIGWVRKAWPKDREVAVAAPALLLVRAVALTLGTLLALVVLLYDGARALLGRPAPDRVAPLESDAGDARHAA